MAATTVTYDAGTKRIDVNGAFGDASDLTVTQSGGSYSIEDSVGVVAGSASCSGGGTVVTCPDPGQDFGPELVINVADLNDVVEISAGATTDVLVNAGAGDDNIRSSGLSRDTFHGHLGADTLDGGAGVDILFGSNDQNLDETIGKHAARRARR